MSLNVQTPPCHMCPAICCHYYAMQIDTPEDKEDFENIKWYVAHQGTTAYVEEGEWYLEIKSRCKYLGGDNRCTVYDRRPQMCRDYGNDDKGEVNCHMSEGEMQHEHFFSTIEDIEFYVNEHYDFE